MNYDAFQGKIARATHLCISKLIEHGATIDQITVDVIENQTYIRWRKKKVGYHLTYIQMGDGFEVKAFPYSIFNFLGNPIEVQSTEPIDAQA